LKKIVILLLLLSFSRVAIAQINLPPVYEIKADTGEYLNLNINDWQVLEDSSGKLTVDLVRESPHSDQFHSFKGFDYSIKVFWVRYRLKNDLPHEKEITIPGDWPANFDVYLKNSSGKWDHKRTGRMVPWNLRDGMKKIAHIPYIIQPGEELLIYERLEFDNGFPPQEKQEAKIRIGLANKIIQEQYIDYDVPLLSTLIIGIFLAAAFLNLYFFAVVRERVYLYFALTLLGRAGMNLISDYDILFREHPMEKSYLTSGLALVYFFCIIHFVRYFLGTFKYVPRWDKFLIALSIYVIVISILSRWIIIFEPFYAIMMFCLFLTFLLFIRSPDKSVRWRVIVVLPSFMTVSIPLCIYIFSTLEKYAGIPIPSSIHWLDNSFHLLEAIALVWLVIFFSWSLFDRYQQLQKQLALEALERERKSKEREIERSLLIEQQKVELERQVVERTSELKKSFEDLKSTQAQLIQSEKMASLGELTAGIAHEIQNPLNFVNNFSDVNAELIDELEQEANKGNLDEVRELARDLKANEQKINHHGKRAGAIVKGMLEHSRASTGQKEPTAINELAEEYLRLSYQGWRARDKQFNAVLKTDFDSTVGKINIVSQDISRVLLNLYNNAFYSVAQKSRVHSDGYEPTVFVSSKRDSNKIEISVKDNGGGIPQKILDKIFQPFFTTKPTGQGTGLGLSLSYDIVRAHGGEINVETKEGEFSEFVIKLPVA
jgi:signal transduction histidine kinase